MNKPAPHTLLTEMSYFPPVQTYSKFFYFQNVIFESCENYQKGGYRNRCHICGPNGLQVLSIPRRKGKNEQLHIREVRIAYDENWQKQQWNSIVTAYKRAPYFDFYADYFESFFTSRMEFLFDWNLKIFETMRSLASFPANIYVSEKYEKQPAVAGVLDFRNIVSPQKKAKHDDDYFIPVSYPQVFEYKHGFLSHLSVLDLLFCTGPEAVIYLKKMVPNFEIG